MRLIVISLFAVISIFGYSQNKALLYSWGDYHGGYTTPKIIEDGDNFQVLRIETVTSEMLKSRNRGDLAAQLTQKGMTRCNNVEIFKVSKDGMSQPLRKSYWMLPGENEINPNNETNKFYSEAEIRKMMPDMFKTSGEVKQSYINQRIKGYEFDTYYQQYFESSSELIKCSHPTRKDNMASRATYATKYNDKTNSVIAAYPDEYNKEDKFSCYKNYEILLTTPSCEIRNQKKVQFDYPRIFKEEMAVYDLNDNNKTTGQILLFEYLNAGKEADPNKENIQLVYLPNEGEIVATVVKFRPDKKGYERIHGFFSDGENLYASFHAYGSDGLKAGIMKIGKEGKYQITAVTEEQVRAKTIMTPGNFTALQHSRKELGLLNDKPSLKWGTQEFKLQGIKSTDTKIYEWGQAVYNVGDPNFTGTGLPPIVTFYAEGFVFVYDKTTMELENLHVLNIPCNRNEYKIRLIGSKGDELEFFAPCQAINNQDYSKVIVTKNSANKERYGEEYKHPMNPLFFKINGSEGKFKYYKDIYALDLEKGLTECKDGTRYVVGIEIYAGTDKDDAGVLEYRNRHHFYIVPMNY